MRTILHSDLNSCYASIELLYRPEMRGKPCAVGGDVESRHGIILAKNDLAKKCGVTTGETLWQARQKCPDLVIVPPDFDLYWRFCKRVRNIYGEYTDQVEPYGLDESWLDVTGSRGLFGDGMTIAEDIRTRVKRELGLTVSIGVSFNKIFAKLGSDMKKPDAITCIPKESFRDIVWPLPVSDLLYVGRATEKKLQKYGIKTIGALANLPPEAPRSLLGKMGEVLYAFANGWDAEPVAKLSDIHLIKSIGNGVTAPRDLTNQQDADIVITVLAESVAERLRELGYLSTILQIEVRTNDMLFYSRQMPLPRPTALSYDFISFASDLLHRKHIWSRPIRGLGVRACGLVGADTAPLQMSLFSDEEARQKRESLDSTVDGLRKRFGRGIIVRGNTLLDTKLSGFDPRQHTIHPVSYFR